MSNRVIAIALLAVVTIGVLFTVRSFRDNAADYVIAHITGNIERELDEISDEARDILNDSVNLVKTRQLTSSRHFFLFERTNLIAWTSNEFVPEINLISDSGSFQYIRYRADFLARRWDIGADHYLVAVLPLYRDYKIQNNNLAPWRNLDIFSNVEGSILEKSATAGSPIYYQDEVLFMFDIRADPRLVFVSDRILAVVALTCAILLVLVVFIRWIRKWRTHHPDEGFLVLAGGLLLIRTVSFLIDFPNVLLNASLFDPRHYASSEWNPSLGDLLINSGIVLWLCIDLFRWFPKFRLFHYLQTNKLLNPVFRVFCTLCCFFAILFPYVVVQSVYNNSPDITLSISNLVSLDQHGWPAFLVLIMSWLSAFLFFHIFFRMLIQPGSSGRYFFAFVIGVLLFVLINELTGQVYLPALIAGTVFCVTLFITRLYRSFTRFDYITFTYIVISAVAFSAVIGTAIRNFSVQELRQSQFRFANEYLVGRDDFVEYLLNEAKLRIESDAFIQTRMASPFLDKEAIREKIRQLLLPSYLDRYTVTIFLYGPGGEPLENRNTLTVQEFTDGFATDLTETSYPGIGLIEETSPSLTQRYIVHSRILRSGIHVGDILLQFSLNRYVPESVYPELLVDNRFQQDLRLKDFSYAIWSDNALLVSYGDYNYQGLTQDELLSDPRVFTQGITAHGYHHTATRAGSNRVAIVSSPVDPLVAKLADFAFPFVLGLSLLLIYLIYVGLLAVIRKQSLLLSVRIQLLLNLAFFVPLIVVSIITLTLVTVTFKDELSESYLDRSDSFSNQLARLLSGDHDPDQIQSEVANWSRVADVDANLYAPTGYLIASSQPQIIENQLVSAYLHPSAIEKLEQGETNFITVEQVGRLAYYVSYATIRTPETGNVIGVVGIPFFQSGYNLEHIQTTILANILVIFTAVFIVLFSVSFFVSKWLTYPFRLITKSLGKTSLVEANQPLSWSADDEIGMMVKEYNEMLVKLQESKAELERSHRERAWREIAQQVAHEIRNPLTPMKLKLQKLERNANSGEQDPVELKKAIDSLLVQVDTLNNIAASFSTFAKMPEPKVERVELVALLNKVIELHGSASEVLLHVEEPLFNVKGDEQLLGRIFANIVINALQAKRAGSDIRVDIRIQPNDRFCRIVFEDNGTGMDYELQRKIFIPHFSTKHSGSGLGLAIAKQGIELMGGKISFTSVPGEGTTFFIDLPLE